MSQHPGCQRSVLVVGDGLTAAATAGFLDGAGLDPVVAPPPSRGQSTGVTVLWRPGLVLLERIGLRRPIERLGEALTCRRCLTTDRSWTAGAAEGDDATDDDQPTLVAIDRSRLASVLESHVLSTLRLTDRAVTAVDSAGCGVRASFTGGVTESFDAVVTTCRSLLRSREPSPAGVGWWQFAWPDGPQAPPAPAALWSDRRAALFVPAGDDTGGVDVRLVSTAGIDAASALSTAALDREFGDLFAHRPTPFAALDPQRLQYRRLPRPVPTTLSDGGLVLVGAESRSTIPGDCLGAARGIEDAWIVADSLAYGPDNIDAAVDDSERRRRQRAREYVAAVAAAAEADRQSADSPPLTDGSSWLRQLRARRRLAFSHTRAPQLPPVAESIPQRL